MPPSPNLKFSRIIGFSGDGLNIERATPGDLPAILGLIRAVISDMNGRGNEQWNEDYPKPEKFENDIREGTLFAMKDKKELWGLIVVSGKQDDQYAAIDWTDKKGKIIALHRLAVSPAHHRKGVADALMDFAEMKARNEGYSSIRVDTYYKNDRSQALLAKRGYLRLPGQINFPECPGPYYCYELVLE